MARRTSSTTPVDPPPATPVDPQVAELATEVRGSLLRLYRRLRSQRASGDLGDTAMAVLTRLHDDGPLTLTALGEEFRVTLASMSQTVNRLTSAGYAVRSTDPADRRRVLISATRAGSALARSARTQRHAWFQARVAELSARDRATLARAAVLLGAIADDPRSAPDQTRP